ncbi:MAG: nicotinate-nicotinamide nucleotide adenylyltransferase [Myxococcales bacterium]|nr:nicotinate-nicotinamide nucleotide adenylyltransferase [Myxococcales bacterium]MCB9671762.1 nicotinate-nicotinamide nucleotide adenylyltransferase [Alphaproteobacteria bacterium]
MRVAIYGGSFNPPHVGHAMVAAWLGWTSRVDRVWLVPTGSHAFGKRLLPFGLRVEMCEVLARCAGSHVDVCTIEAELPVPSYTIDTLRALAVRHPEHTFQLVVGADILPETPRWKAWDAIAREFEPIVVGRGGHGDVEGMPTFPEVSSTVIRARHDAGQDVSALVPSGVLALLEGQSFTA